jgi:hypothetical protein
MSSGVLGRARELVDDVRWAREVGIADAERDDVDALGSGGGDLAVDLGEQVRGELLDPLCGPQEEPPR